ncbi:MAG: fumarate hydratase [Candidatus Riflebacteria bacterium HGW-Riflebacteria-1]|jgi:fumarate hydratase class I|nr:MAG: fumarate hydratase [Candidatus Riflebacteria bacterium HGW-Riflebacteria-1]
MNTRQYRKISSDSIHSEKNGGRSFLNVAPSVLTQLAAEAFRDLSYYLRPDHLDELAAIAADPAAAPNERFVCSSLVKNAIIAAEGKLPLCQDTGTATIFAWRGERVLTGGADEEMLTKGVAQAWSENFLRYSQVAPLSMFAEKNTGNNLPAQIDIAFSPGEEYRFMFMAKGGGSANKTLLLQGSRALLNEKAFAAFLKDKIGGLGVAACPPYTLVVVVGGTSPEINLKTMKLASTGWYDDLPTTADGSGSPYRDLEWEARARDIAAETGWGAQFGGSHLVLEARVIRMARHAGSCPVSVGVSCSAHRNMLGKITAEGAFLEILDKNPARLLEKIKIDSLKAAAIDLDRPMPEILLQLASQPAGSLVMLNGTMVVARDMAHARLFEMVSSGQPMPDYFKNHPVYYAGPARTPPGYAIGSFGPTTAQRMDEYIDFFMSRGASLVTLAKGNRAEGVIKACSQYGGFYLGTIGGAAALIASENIISSEVLDFAEFGMEAVHRIKVKNMPAFVIYDAQGNSLY